MTVTERNGETILSVEDAEGISVEQLYELLGQLIANDPNIKQSPVALCLPEVDTYTTLITQVVNEGDNSVVWFKVRPETENAIISNKV